MSVTEREVAAGENIFSKLKMNDDAELYEQNNMLQKRDAFICLKDYTPKMKWKDFDKIIDVGCGDGNVTNSIKNYVPSNFKELVGCDINDRMVYFANQKYADRRTSFRVLDIEAELPRELKGEFDHVFSFNAMHWPKKQVEAFTNIYELLSKGGDCLISIMGYFQVYSSFLTVTGTKKWNKLLPTCEGFVSPYHDFQEPEKYLAHMLQKIGFNNVDVRSKQMYFIYENVNNLKDTLRSVNPFKLSEEATNDLIEDYITVLQDMRVLNNPKDNLSNSTAAKVHYNMIVIHASKS